MKKLTYTLALFLAITSFSACIATQKTSETQILPATTYILVRHAEKELGVSNPALTKEGHERAKNLAYLLKDVEINAIYSSNYTRTRQTAKPTAKEKNINIQSYDPQNLEALVIEVEKKYAGKTVLVVGHSNTTPPLANLLSGTTYADFDESIYDNFFVIEAYGQGRGKALLLKF